MRILRPLFLTGLFFTLTFCTNEPEIDIAATVPPTQASALATVAPTATLLPIDQLTPLPTLPPTVAATVDVSVQSAEEGYPAPPTPDPAAATLAAYPEPGNDGDFSVDAETDSGYPVANTDPETDEQSEQSAEGITESEQIYDTALTGLMFMSETGIRYIDNTGINRSFLGFPDPAAVFQPVLSSDLAQTAYFSNDDLLLQPFIGDLQNLTEQAGRIECCFAEWISDGRLLFGSRGADESGFANNGVVSVIDPASAEYILIGEQASFGLPDASNDGTLVAYDEAGTPQIRLIDGTTTLPIPGDSIAKAWSVSWSPVGERLAWLVQTTDQQLGLAIVDLGSDSAEIFHPYTAAGREWLPERPAWSPDGQWVAFEAIPQDANQSGIWLINPLTREERYIGAGSRAIWSPDGSHLVVQGGDSLLVYEVATGTTTFAPFAGSLLDWRSDFQ